MPYVLPGNGQSNERRLLPEMRRRVESERLRLERVLQKLRAANRRQFAIGNRARPERRLIMNGETLLSKWWQSDSCKRAYARAEAKRGERIEQMKREVNA